MLKVLIVEDDHNIATIYKIKFEHSDFDCVHAYNGLEALHALKTFSPDIILLDLKMPVMDGETFLKHLRKNQKYDSIPVVVLTNLNASEAPKTLWHLGIAAYIIKAHMTPTEVMQKVHTIIQSSDRPHS